MKVVGKVSILVLLGLVALYLAFSPRLNHDLYRSLLFHPERFDLTDGSAPQIAGVDGEDVHFKNTAGNTLHGWYFYDPDAKYTVLLSHGNGGNVSNRADTVSLLLKAGASVLIYDYRGYGNSEGLPDVEGICNDGCAAYDFLRTVKKIPADRIVLYGESLGAAVTAYISSVRPSAGIVVQSGFCSLYRIATETYPIMAIYPGALLARPTLDTLSILKRPHSPLLIVHGGMDDTIPFAHARDLYSQAADPKRFLEIPQCGHNDICYSVPGQYMHALREFLDSLGDTSTQAQSKRANTHS